LIAVVFAGAAFLFAALYFLLRRSVKLASEQVKEIIEDAHTNRQIRIQSPDKQLEKLLAEVNRLLEARQTDRIVHERKEREIRKQISNITHDLRTPLTSMLGYVQLLQEDDVTADEAQEYLKVVEKRAQALRSLIVGFYDLSRIEARDYPVVMQQSDLQILLKRVLADYYPEFAAAGFRVNLDLSEAGCIVSADEEIVARIYMNLLQNVLKHGRNSLTVFQGMKDGRYIAAFANETDSLREDDVPRLFERSFTANQARTEHNTGLGLAVVKELMQQMGYRVRAEYSAPVFTVYLEWHKHKK